MFELVQALHEGAEALRNRFTNSISINAGCELFIAFVTLFPHESSVSAKLYPFRINQISVQDFKDLKIELVEQGRQYAREAMLYREKIAELALGFIKDGSVVSWHSAVNDGIAYLQRCLDSYTFVFSSGHAGPPTRTPTETNLGLCHRS